MSTTLRLWRSSTGASTALRATTACRPTGAYPLKSGSSTKFYNTGWMMSPTFGVGALGLLPVTTVNGPAALEAGSFHVSAPVDQNFTLSGTITATLWGDENSMAANAAVGCRIHKVSRDGTTITLIGDSFNGTELGTTSSTRVITITPTSTSFVKGDRIAFTHYFTDATATTMAAGSSVKITCGATSAGVDGDSNIVFTETFGFLESLPTGSTLYFQDGASPVGGSLKEMWTSRGSGVATSTTTTVAGPTSGLQFTDTAGGTAIAWISKPVQAFTLSGPVQCNLRGINPASFGQSTTALVVIYITDTDGSNAVEWGRARSLDYFQTSEAAIQNWVVVGPDTSVANGKRIKAILYHEDMDGANNYGDMNAGNNMAFKYAGTGSGATGDSWLRFGQTLTEFVAGGPPQDVGPLGLIDASNAVYAPDLTQQFIYPTLIDAARTVYAPTVLPQPVTVGPLGLIDGSRAVLDLVVALGGAATTIIANTIDAANAVYAPTILQTQTAVLDFIDALRAVYDIGVQAKQNVVMGLIDAVRSVLQLDSVANAQTPVPLPEVTDARYLGSAMAIHVESDSNPSVAQPVDPNGTDEARYRGTLYPIITNADSPSYFDPDSLNPTLGWDGSYWGMSKAIHVWGSDGPAGGGRTIKACKCCENPQAYSVISSTNNPSGDSQIVGHTADDGSGANAPGTMELPSPPNAYGWANHPYIRAGNVWMGSPFNQWQWQGTYVRISALPAGCDRVRITQWITTSPWDDVSGPGAEDSLSFELWRADWGPTLSVGETGINASSAELVQTYLGMDLGNTYDTPFPGATQQITVEWDKFPSQSGYAECFFRPTPRMKANLVNRDWTQESITTFLHATGFTVATSALGDCTEDLTVTCDSCDDPTNPGVQIPPFTPGYLPIFRKQIGDPTTGLDGYLCTLESGAMLLDWHTRGAVQVWGGELVPYCGKTYAQIQATGTNLGNVKQAWLHWGQYLDIRSGGTWFDFLDCLGEGRAAILQGDYGQFTINERCQDNFTGDHAMLILPYASGGRLLTGDPLCSDFKGFRETSLRAYAEDFGAAVFGVTSPQKILFAVSRPYAP